MSGKTKPDRKRKRRVREERLRVALRKSEQRELVALAADELRAMLIRLRGTFRASSYSERLTILKETDALLKAERS